MGEELSDRWAFTTEELTNPSACSRDDLFRAEVFPENEGDDPEPIWVNRRGEALKPLADGTLGVVIEMRDDIDYDVLIKEDDDDTSLTSYADQWRNIVVDDEGRFVAFQT